MLDSEELHRRIFQEIDLSEELEDEELVQREIETMIAAKRMEFKVMTVIPLGIIVYMKISFPEFMSVLYRSIAGSFVMTGCLFSYVGAWYLGEKILEIEV